MKLFGPLPESTGKIIKGNKIDIIALFTTFWFYRVSMAFVVVILVVVTLLVSVAIPARYKASTSFIPLSEERMSLGQLGSLASLAGMDLNSLLGTSTSLNSDLYPSVVQSYPFLSSLLASEFRDEATSGKTTLYGILNTSLQQNWTKYLARYTIQLPWTLKGFLFGREGVVQVSEANVIVMTEEDEAVFEHLIERLEMSIDKNTGLVSISVFLEDPLLAAHVTQKAFEVLQQLVIEHKTKQVRENLAFINERFTDKRIEFEAARQALNNYRDSHRNIIPERTGAELKDLEMAYDMANSVYQMLAQQVEQANLAVKKETPVFSVIEPVKVPVRKNSPNIGLNLFFSIVVGGFLALCVVTGKIILFHIKR